MVFSVGPESRASAADNLKLSPFSVFADRKFSAIEEPMIIMSKLPVTYNQTAALWEYEGATQYWFPRHEHSFVAVYPV